MEDFSVAIQQEGVRFDIGLTDLLIGRKATATPVSERKTMKTTENFFICLNTLSSETFRPRKKLLEPK